MRNALWLDSLTITEEPRRSYDGKMRWEERAEIGPMVEIGLPYLAAIVSAVEWIEALAYDCESSDVVNEAAKDHILALKQRRGEVEIELSPVVQEAILAVRMAVDEAIGVE